MKLAIIGYGQMGQLIEGCAKERNLEVASIIDPFHPRATHRTIDNASTAEADVCICFTQPDAAMSNIVDICKCRKNAVIGTTGWADRMEDVRKMVDESGIGMVYSSNFSIGVNIFFKMIEQAAHIMNRFDIYDVMAFEAHHKKKIDSPSGTATTIANLLLEKMDRKNKVVEEKLDRKIEPDEIHIASVRGGSIPGTHSVLFDSEFDTIEIKHTARNRIGFATGAVIASEWIEDKKGLFTEADMMHQLLG